MKVFTLAFLLVFIGVKAEDGLNEELSLHSLPTLNKLEGGITAYGALNNINKKNSFARDKKPHLGVFGIIKMKSEETFNQNDFGLLAEVELNSEDKSNPFQVKEAGVILEGEKNGIRIFGFQKPVTSKMKVNSTTFSGANEGIAGRWQNFINYPNFQENHDPFLTKPYMGLESGIFSFPSIFYSESMKTGFLQPSAGWGESGIGVSYVTPRFSGIRLGASYSPDNRIQLLSNNHQEGINGMTTLLLDKNFYPGKASYLRNILSASANYYTEIEGIEILLSAGFESGSYVPYLGEESTFNIKESKPRKNLQNYSIGANFSYMGFTLGGSFIDMRKSLQYSNIEDRKSAEFFSTTSYDIGIGYSIDKYNLNISHFKSRYAGNGFSSIAFSFETKITKNLINYLQIAGYSFNIKGEPADKGTVIMIGLHYKL